METNIQIFKDEKFGEIRIVEVNGEPQFCLADICRVVELTNPFERTGCMFCGFGAHLEKFSRFEYLMENYPKMYRWFLGLENNGVTYEQALNKCGVILPHQGGFQRSLLVVNH